MTTPTFNELVMAVSASTPGAINDLYEFVDEAIGATDGIFVGLGYLTPERTGFKEVDDGLEALDVEQLSTTAMLAVLTITYSRRSMLPHRGHFFERCKAKLQRTEPSEWPGLLMGLDA